MDPLNYYTQQSLFTNPGRYASLFADLPPDLGELCRVVDNLYVHYMSEAYTGYAIPQERLQEINLLYLEKMLARIVELDDRPLTEPRSPEKKLVGCCRDAAVLFVAMARHMGIPARVRVGFGDYFTKYDPDFACNHVIAEVWDAANQCWHLVDPDLNERSIQDNAVSFDPLDVPRNRFQVGGLAWQLYRSGAIDPRGYGVSASSGMAGAPFIRGCLVQDLAALNKMELLCWDCWGMMLKDMSAHTETELSLMDQIAACTVGENVNIEAVRELYDTDERLRVPERIIRFDPLGAPTEVLLV